MPHHVYIYGRATASPLADESPSTLCGRRGLILGGPCTECLVIMDAVLEKGLIESRAAVAPFPLGPHEVLAWVGSVALGGRVLSDEHGIWDWQRSCRAYEIGDWHMAYPHLPPRNGPAPRKEKVRPTKRKCKGFTPKGRGTR